jgi:hypothetical protein
MRHLFVTPTLLARIFSLSLCTLAVSAWAQPAGKPASVPAPVSASASAPANASPSGNADTKPAQAVRITQPSSSPLLTDRLFFSEEERSRLDRARARGVTTDELDAGLSLSPTLDGVVRQVGGRTTYWVNGAVRVPAAKGREPVVPNSMIGPELKAKVVGAASVPVAETKAVRRPTREAPSAPSRDNSAR